MGLRPAPRSLIRLRLNGNTILLCEAKGMARRKLTPFKVYCTAEERAGIEHRAETVGLSVSEYLRSVGMGTPVKSRVDQQAVRALAKTNADLGRAGGLLKMLLKNEERLLGYSGAQLKQMTASTVNEITRLQSSLALISQKIIKDYQ